ncbi:MAG TPA: hypothetical protein VNM48_18120 [Chloroflexota bacterium]|nr:hypothetical protein [Chloroflexota bacterium]
MSQVKKLANLQRATSTRSAAEIAAAVIAPLMALLASQHHLVHMVVIGAATGSAGMSLMAAYPSLRRMMLAISLILASLGLLRIWRSRSTFAAWLATGLSTVLTVALAAWSVGQFGLKWNTPHAMMGKRAALGKRSVACG